MGSASHAEQQIKAYAGFAGVISAAVPMSSRVNRMSLRTSLSFNMHVSFGQCGAGESTESLRLTPLSSRPPGLASTRSRDLTRV